MDKRLKPVDPTESLKERQALYAALRDGALSLPEAVKRLRRLSKLTQPEFAAHRGISVQALRQIESGRGNPTIETLNKIVEVFGLQVGFVARRRIEQMEERKRTPRTPTDNSSATS